MENQIIILIVVAAVALSAAAALLISLLRVSASRSKLIISRQEEERSFQSKIDALLYEKTVLESRLSAREEYVAAAAVSYEKSLEAEKSAHEKSLQIQKENHEQTLSTLKENHERALQTQKEAHERALQAQKESYEKALLTQRESCDHTLLAQKETHEKALSVQKEQLEKGLESMKSVFKSLTAENSELFKNQSADVIAELLKPVKDKFTEFDKSVRESQKDSAAQSAALKTHIDDVLKQSRAVGDEARHLADALSGRSKTQGDFGEMILADVLKNAGLTEGIHFVTQSVMSDAAGREIKSDSGSTLIPDVIVYYPDDTAVIVDSKVSLSAYRKYITAESVADRTLYAREHLESVRKHVDELKKKDYASYLPSEKKKVDYNIMFIPMEGAFRLVLEEDALLWQVAKENNVLIVSQMTLVIVLNMIKMAWKQASQERNIEEVYKTASELMSQLKGWMDSYVDIGEHLKKASRAYDVSTGKLNGSNQCVIRKIEKLENLGLSPRRSSAKIKTGTRLQAPASVIPAALSDSVSDTDPRSVPGFGPDSEILQTSG